MTETEWLASADPAAMFAHLAGVRRRGRRRDQRRPRLLVAAFWRWQAGNIRPADRVPLLDAVALAEQWAETGIKPAIPARLKRYFVLVGPAGTAARDTIQAAINAGTPRYQLAQDYKVHLLRELWGNPFRPAAFDPAWLAYNDGTINRLARSVYDGAFETLPILGDALEEAGCADAAVLAHCRDPGPHVRGCWVVDGLLGKG